MEEIRVLIVDDEMGMRLGAQRALKNFKTHVADVDVDVAIVVDGAESAEQALEMINNHPPDILLLDYKLPGMTGLDLLEKIAPHKENMRIVMITAYASIDTAVVAIKRGAYDFLAKPFTPAELRAQVEKAVENLVIERQAKKLAQEKKQVRFQFIRVVAHELKAPLAAIQGYLQILQDLDLTKDPTQYNKILDRVIIRSDGMRKLISDLLDLTHIESGKKARELTEVDLSEMAQMAYETVLPSAQERGITVNLHNTEPIKFLADRSEIEIIFNNLISNAVKYNRDNGSVDVNITPTDDKVVISVADSGIGMTEDEASRLFGDFVRIRNTKTRDILGSGLGLSIIKKLAYLYNGEVNVKSQPDVGTTFTITLRHTSDVQEPQEAEHKPTEQ
ncbi:MAG: response regulator [Phycisphaerae bacterium]|nr:response regulator [Phycisphaerae bacterium]